MPDLSCHIHFANIDDIDKMVLLSKLKRLAYEKAQPMFWAYAGEDGDEKQKAWFKELLNNSDYLILTAKDANQDLVGFVIGRLISAPEVYQPGGLTLMIDDFCVLDDKLWPDVGRDLIKEIKRHAQAKGAIQVIVVCGAHDHFKTQFLKDNQLSIVSHWYWGDIHGN